MGSPPGWSWRSFLRVVVQPILFRIIKRVDHLWHQLVLLGDLEHGTRVLVPSTVVRGREDSEELSACESLEAIHDALVGPQHELRFIILEEELDAVWPELHDVARAVRVTHEVRLDASLLIRVCGVRPKDVDNELLLWGGNFMDNV